MPRLSPSWRHRVAAAGAEVDARWIERAAAIFAEELRTAPGEVQVAVMRRLHDLQQRGAWKGDVVEVALREIEKVAPEIAAHVRKRLGMGEAQ